MLTQPGFIMLKITGKRGQTGTFSTVGNGLDSQSLMSALKRK